MTNTLITRTGHQAVVSPARDFVAASAPELRTVLRGAIADGVRDMTLDFTHVQMVDSTGIGLLIAAHNSMRKVGGRLAVIHVSSEILQLFKAMRIHQHFSVSEDRAEAS